MMTSGIKLSCLFHINYLTSVNQFHTNSVTEKNTKTVFAFQEQNKRFNLFCPLKCETLFSNIPLIKFTAQS